MATITSSTTYKGRRYTLLYSNDNHLLIDLQDRSNAVEFNIKCDSREEFSMMKHFSDEQWRNWLKSQLPGYT